MFEQLKYAIYGKDGKMEMKELVAVNFLVMVWFMLFTSIWPGYQWSDAWVVAIPVSLVGAIFGIIYQRKNEQVYNYNNHSADSGIGGDNSIP